MCSVEMYSSLELLRFLLSLLERLVERRADVGLTAAADLWEPLDSGYQCGLERLYRYAGALEQSAAYAL